EVRTNPVFRPVDEVVQVGGQVVLPPSKCLHRGLRNEVAPSERLKKITHEMGPAISKPSDDLHRNENLVSRKSVSTTCNRFPGPYPTDTDSRCTIFASTRKGSTNPPCSSIAARLASASSPPVSEPRKVPTSSMSTGPSENMFTRLSPHRSGSMQ